LFSLPEVWPREIKCRAGCQGLEQGAVMMVCQCGYIQHSGSTCDKCEPEIQQTLAEEMMGDDEIWPDPGSGEIEKLAEQRVEPPMDFGIQFHQAGQQVYCQCLGPTPGETYRINCSECGHIIPHATFASGLAHQRIAINHDISTPEMLDEILGSCDWGLDRKIVSLESEIKELKQQLEAHNGD